MLEGFKKFDMAVGTSTISFTEYGVSFSKACIIRLGKPRYVDFLIDYENKKVAIVSSPENTDGAFQFYNPEKKSTSVRWNNKDLISEIENLMGWDLKKGGYKAFGEYLPDEHATVFDLKNAEPLK